MSKKYTSFLIIYLIQQLNRLTVNVSDLGFLDDFFIYTFLYLFVKINIFRLPYIPIDNYDVSFFKNIYVIFIISQTH
jgi:hypothetical protein